MCRFLECTYLLSADLQCARFPIAAAFDNPLYEEHAKAAAYTAPGPGDDEEGGYLDIPDATPDADALYDDPETDF